MKKTWPQQHLESLRAAQENDLSILLRPYYSFRVFLKFKIRRIEPKTGKILDANHCYGIENKCSYSQCLNGHVGNIILDKQQGFRNCIRMIEEKFWDKGVPLYRFAQIYQRVVFPNGKFDILNRHYNNKGERILELINTNTGEVTTPQEPVISVDDNITLYFKEAGGILTITEEVLPSAAEFKEMISNSLHT